VASPAAAEAAALPKRGRRSSAMQEKKECEPAAKAAKQAEDSTAASADSPTSPDPDADSSTQATAGQETAAIAAPAAVPKANIRTDGGVTSFVSLLKKREEKPKAKPVVKALRLAEEQRLAAAAQAKERAERTAALRERQKEAQSKMAAAREAEAARQKRDRLVRGSQLRLPACLHTSLSARPPACILACLPARLATTAAPRTHAAPIPIIGSPPHLLCSGRRSLRQSESRSRKLFVCSGYDS